ncbi:MAG TPA: D-alanine--D-alanine ligase [Syntrophaceae bacterium]|jgi:D-alanine-D-alanine ligase|nr:D-alanine--D-alanine ligase [Syntrophaceae bacterium]
MKVVVLYGEVSADAGMDEKDALVQVAAVSSALTDIGYTPIIIPLSLNFLPAIESLKKIQPSFVFNLVETLAGQGSLIHMAPSLLDYLGIPYTGAGTEAIFMTSNKVTAKKLFLAAGITTPPLFLPYKTLGNSFVEGTYIIKSVWEHASTWLDENSIISAGDMHSVHLATLAQQEKLGMECFAEKFIEGREFNLSLLAGEKGPEVLPPAEILFDDFPPGKSRVVDYRSKWVEDSFEYHHTPRTFDFVKKDDSLLLQLTDFARQCWDTFDLRGYARVDFRVDNAGLPWVLEVNTNPCLSPDGGFFAALERSGMSFTHAMERIIKDIKKGASGFKEPRV